MSPEAFTTKDFFEAEETLPRLRGDFDFIIVTPGVMDADCNEKLISCVLFEKELCVNVAINIYYARVILITFAGLFRACKKKAFCRRLVFIVMRLRRDYERSLSMRMDISATMSHGRNLTRHRDLKNPK